MLQDSVVLNATRFIGVDAFEAVYYLQENTLVKYTKKETYYYQNNSLGAILNVDLLNPLEIMVFYKDFNTVVQLDPTLAEIKTVNFNTTKNFMSAGYISTCSNHRFWVFNENTLQIEIYNPNTQQKDAVTQPIIGEIINIKSDYNYCWVLTKSQILKYNNYGNLLNTYEMETVDGFCKMKKNFILQQKNELFVYNMQLKTKEKLQIPKITIQDVFVKAETVYIYDGNILYSYIIN